MRSAFLLLFLACPAAAMGYTWLVEEPVQDPAYSIVVVDVSQGCPEKVRTAAREAIAVWDRYVPFRLLYGSGTRVEYDFGDGRFTVTCRDRAEYQALGRDKSTAVTFWSIEDGAVVEADVIVNNALYRDCTMPHEIGHVIGLGHSSYEQALMYEEGCKGNALTYDEVAGVSALYQQAPDCTPWAYDDRSAYFPHIAGQWVRLSPAGRVVDYGPSPAEGWECSLDYGPGRVRTSIWYQRELLEVAFHRQGDQWIPNLID